MRQKVLIGIAALAALLLVRNFWVIFLELPDEAAQGAIWRIFCIHLPAAITSFLGFFVALFLSAAYLVKRDLRLDALAVSVTEVSFTLSFVVLVTGMIWARIIWGIWWAWDARLTSFFICMLIYSGYLMLRRVIDEPHTRARLSAVLALFGCINVIIVWFSIQWWRTQHPGPVLSIRSGGGGMDPNMESAAWWNVLALIMLAAVLAAMRFRQENTQREVDGLRRLAHSM